MNRYGTYITDNILTDDYEQIHYSHPELPYYVTLNKGARNRLQGIPHWHQDVEISVIVRGTSEVEVDGIRHVIETGCGYFVNSRHLHAGRQADKDFICLRFHPIILCSSEYIERNFVMPLINDQNMAFTRLDPEVPWQKRIIDLVFRVYEADRKKDPSLALLIESVCFEIWKLLFDHRPVNGKKTVMESSRMTCLKQMLGYIQEHYSERVTLSDIAAAGHVSVSTCNTVFNDLIHQAPVRYLLSYRLDRAAEYLGNTDLPVTEIASKCGIPGVSYFAEVFHRQYGMTPTAFRRQMRKNQNQEESF